MKRHDLIQILTFALVAVVGVGAAFIVSLNYLSRSRAQDAPPPPPPQEQPAQPGDAPPGQAPANPQAAPAEQAQQPQAAPTEQPPAPTETPNGTLYERLNQVPLGGAEISNGLKAAQEAAAKKEAEAAAIVDMPAVDPNHGRTQAQPDPGAGGGQNANQGTGGGGISGISELEGFLEPFIYDETNRRDPFLAYGISVPVAGETEAPRILAPIQKFPLAEFKLVGVLWDVKTPKAMVVSSNQELFIVERDQSIGIDNGYVAAIRESEIVVVEPVKKRGDVTYKTTVLRMER